MGKYIYCVIGENGSRNFGSIGIDGQEVVALPYGDIAAVASNTEVTNFDTLGKEKLTSHIATHQKVNEALLKVYDVVPMAFGMVADNVEELERMLAKCYLQFKTALQKIAGKVEFVVQVFWDRQRLLGEILEANPEIRKLQEASKRGIVGMGAKIQLGKFLYEKSETQRQAYIENINASLKDLFYDSTSHKLIDEQMIANLSFLIEKSQEPELDRRMAQLGEQYEGRLRFKYIGPMPPNSFTNINFRLGNFEIINEARKALGVGEQVSRDEMRRAYYVLAQTYHPDTHGGSNETTEEMKKIIQAYSILESYCQSFDELHGQERKEQNYSFKKEDVENSVLIS